MIYHLLGRTRRWRSLGLPSSFVFGWTVRPRPTIAVKVLSLSAPLPVIIMHGTTLKLTYSTQLQDSQLLWLHVGTKYFWFVKFSSYQLTFERSGQNRGASGVCWQAWRQQRCELWPWAGGRRCCRCPQAHTELPTLEGNQRGPSELRKLLTPLAIPHAVSVRQNKTGKWIENYWIERFI